MDAIWRGEKGEFAAGGGSVRTGRERVTVDAKEAMVRELVAGCRDMDARLEVF